MTKTCALVFRDNFIYCFKEINTGSGRISEVPAKCLVASSAPNLIGDLILQTLNSSPDEIVNANIPLMMGVYDNYKSLGFKSYGAFAKKIRTLSVILQNENVKVLPFTNNGRNGFLPLEAEGRICVIDPESIGRLVFERLPFCDS